MSEQKTNAQVALECASRIYGGGLASRRFYGRDITYLAAEFLRWLELNDKTDLSK